MYFACLLMSCCCLITTKMRTISNNAMRANKEEAKYKKEFTKSVLSSTAGGPGAGTGLVGAGVGSEGAGVSTGAGVSPPSSVGAPVSFCPVGAPVSFCNCLHRKSSSSSKASTFNTATFPITVTSATFMCSCSTQPSQLNLTCRSETSNP